MELLVKKYIKSAGLDYDKFTPHKLRHTAATLMYKYGNVDIRSLQKILGVKLQCLQTLHSKSCKKILLCLHKSNNEIHEKCGELELICSSDKRKRAR